MAILEDRAVPQTAALSDFTALVRRNQAMVFSIALHYNQDRAVAEEVAQEVFLQLYRQLSRLESDEHVTAWLRRTAAHRSIDEARKRKVRPQVALEDGPEPAAAPVENDPMLRERLRRLVASLPEKPRMVMIMRYQEDLMPEEISAALDMPVRTVKSHLQRSLALLREKMGRSTQEGNRA